MTSKLFPTLRAPLIPAPPATVRAPVVEVVEAVVFDVAMVPEVARSPASSMVRVLIAFCWIERAFCVPRAGVLITKAGAVPALVRVKEVGVARPDARVKAILLPDWW